MCLLLSQENECVYYRKIKTVYSSIVQILTVTVDLYSNKHFIPTYQSIYEDNNNYSYLMLKKVSVLVTNRKMKRP